jgi:pilus assembly protein CpaB
MNRKWVGVAVAVALAAVGTWVIVNYVRGAENRALEGQETVAVLVVDSVIPAGSAAQDIASKVRVEMIPVNVQVVGSLPDIDALQSLGDLVASTDLLPGEQVIAERFVATNVLDEMDRVAIPDGMVEVTVSLNPERAIGGVLRPGDVVAVFASFAPQPLDQGVVGESAETGAFAAATESQSTTHIILDDVVVTNVQVEELPRSNTSDDSGTSSLQLSPTGRLLVTLATDPANAERIVYTAEFGSMWLGDASLISDEAATNIQDRGTVYENPAGGR